MRKICLTLPTNRECSATISIMAAEAAYAARHFGVEVHFLILDSTEGNGQRQQELAGPEQGQGSPQPGLVPVPAESLRS